MSDSGHDNGENLDEQHKRGTTVIEKVIRERNKGKKIKVVWNDRGQPIKPGGPTLSCYIGAIVRQKVPITIGNWKDKRMKTYKNMIWDDVQFAFDIDDSRIRYVLMLAGKRHRSFRSTLSTKYVFDENGNTIPHPPKKYADIISQEIWDLFVAQRCQEVFQEVSSKNKERASNPEYPYRASRLGYARLEQQMIEEVGDGRKSIPRHVLWKVTRIDKKKNANNEKIEQVFNQCEILSQSDTGDFSDKELLTKALNKPEYSGRVRGMGFGILPRDYFQSPRKVEKPAPSQKAFDQLQETMKSMLARVENLEGQLAKKNKAEKNQVNCPNNVRGSNSSPVYNLPKGRFHCIMYLGDSTFRVVGKGEAHNFPEQTLHTCPLPPNHLKVMVQIAIEPEAPLPCPIEYAELTTVGEAIGAFVAWPTGMIALDAATPESSKERLKQSRFSKESIVHKSPVREIPTFTAHPMGGGSSYLQFLDMYYNMRMKSSTDTITYKGVLGDDEAKEFIDAASVHALLYHEWLDATIINTYCSYLYKELLLPSYSTDRFVLISPQGTTTYHKNLDHPQYVANIFKDKFSHEGDRLFLAPYNTGTHWVLLAINLNLGTIYFLDSLCHDPKSYKKLKTIFNNAFTIYRAYAGQNILTGQFNTVTWTCIKCPRQTNSDDCGLYVMRFMKEIITQNQTTIPPKYFAEHRCMNYTIAQLDEVREEWAKHIMTTCI